VAGRLVELLGQAVRFAPDSVGEEVEAMVGEMEPGDVCLLENLRFHPGETKNDPAFAARLAGLAEVFVGDAFGTVHRAHASTVGVAQLLRPSVAGLLVAREFEAFQRLLEPDRPYVAVLGGAKVSGKLETLQAILARADRVLVGGGMAATFYLGRGWEVGTSLVERDLAPVARDLLDGPGRGKLELAVDAVVAERLEDGVATEVVDADAVPPGRTIGDIGPASRNAFARRLAAAATVFWNGPMGVFEVPAFAEGTLAVGRAVAAATESGAFTVVGGGDSAAALAQMGLADAVSHLSTGGGAGLELLSGEPLPGIAALEDRVPAAAPR
jgi:phosphoglycerate kinase